MSANPNGVAAWEPDCVGRNPVGVDVSWHALLMAAMAFSRAVCAAAGDAALRPAIHGVTASSKYPNTRRPRARLIPGRESRFARMCSPPDWIGIRFSCGPGVPGWNDGGQQPASWPD